MAGHVSLVSLILGKVGACAINYAFSLVFGCAWLHMRSKTGVLAHIKDATGCCVKNF